MAGEITNEILPTCLIMSPNIQTSNHAMQFHYYVPVETHAFIAMPFTVCAHSNCPCVDAEPVSGLLARSSSRRFVFLSPQKAGTTSPRRSDRQSSSASPFSWEIVSRCVACLRSSLLRWNP